MTVSQTRGVEQIWEDDHLDRLNEAELLIAYLESASELGQRSGQAHSLTISVDAGYGEGKTFFLRRFAEHVGLTHPVAFVDAWSDDLADEPLTALAATLRDALDPLIESSPQLRDRWNEWLTTTGKIAKIAGFGVAKRLLGLLITGAAVTQLDELAEQLGDASETAKEELKGVGGRTVDGVAEGLKTIASDDLMKQQIERFKAGRDAIVQLKASLAALVKALDGNTLRAPIVIVIDELDRCRPTYAIKLLEEVKHLFDAPGVVFVLGMHTEQLGRAVGGVYGASFEGEKYLRRFISRRYRLRTPTFKKLVPVLVKEAGLTGEEFEFLQVQPQRGQWGPISFVDAMEYYLRAYGATPRDAFQIVDRLRTCVSVVRGQRLIGPYLIPLVIAKVLGIEPNVAEEFRMQGAPFTFVWHPINGNIQTASPSAVASKIRSAALKSPADLMKALNSSGNDFAPELVYRLRDAANAAQVPLADPGRYDDLVEAVGRLTTFKAPA